VPETTRTTFKEDLMSDAVSLTELDGQHVELLPARTVLSMFSATQGGAGGSATNGADAIGTPSIKLFDIPLLPGDSNAKGGAGSSADG
jgi:hypothetical protein